MALMLPTNVEATTFQLPDEQRDAAQKERSKRLRRMRKLDVPVIDAEGKVVVEVDRFGKPYGKGRRELRQFLTVQALDHAKNGILGKNSNLIHELAFLASQQFTGPWGTVIWDAWCASAIKKTLRERRCNLTTILKHKGRKPKSLTAGEWESLEKRKRSSGFGTKSASMTAARAAVVKEARSGRGGIPAIKSRLEQIHGRAPSSSKVFEVAAAPFHLKSDLEDRNNETGQGAPNRSSPATTSSEPTLCVQL